ncbi:MAG TPA: glutathione S-transferase [Nevskiaceae bacterium]|nr:glutathione S-transferase [Nevskiaceae bacterium]
MDLPLLWHIPFSHYNEKARWALDYKRIAHRRRSIGVDYLYRAWRATGRGTLPILFLDGRAIGDSTAIIAALEQRQAEPPLYPRDPAQRERALALEDYFDEVLGPSLRAALVSPLFEQSADLGVRVLTTGMPAQTYRNMRPLIWLFPAFYRWRHKISAAQLQRHRANVSAALDRISQELQPGGYLAGDNFCVADLTAAALLAPLLQPAELQYHLAMDMPESMRRYRDETLQHPAAQWALEIYRRHRGTSAEVRRQRAAPA